MRDASFPSRRFLCADFLGLLTAVAGLLPSLACADPPFPPPTFHALVAAGSAANIFTAPGGYMLGPASLVLSLPAASVSEHASENPDVGAGFEGNIGYSLVVVGPNPDVFVPVFASYALHASAIGQRRFPGLVHRRG